VKYPTLPAATDFQAASATCPVRCKWDGERLRVEHMVKHGKMVAWVPSQTPGAHVNKVFHKCYHDAVTAECKCGCAQWDGDCDVGGRQCPTGCGHEASEFAGNLAENDNLKCYYGSDELPDSHCYAPDRNGACAVDCPATVACPNTCTHNFPDPFPNEVPHTKPYTVATNMRTRQAIYLFEFVLPRRQIHAFTFRRPPEGSSPLVQGRSICNQQVRPYWLVEHQAHDQPGQSV